MEHKNIELRSEEVQELIGKVPSKITRNGIGVISLIIVFLFIGSFFFKYPDIITGRLTLSAENPSADIQARVDGKIIQIFVVDKQNVTKDETLAIIENTANFSDVLTLKKYINDVLFTAHPSDSVFLLFNPNNELSVGELQVHYSKLLKKLTDYKDFTKLDFNLRKAKNIEQQILIYKKQLSSYQRQLKLSYRNLTLGKKIISRDSSLLKKDFLSQADFEKSESVFLQKEFDIEDAHSGVSSTELQISNLEQQIFDLTLQQSEEKHQLETNLKEIIENLNAQVALWEQNYVLKSPISGKVNFLKFWSTTQNCKQGETVFFVIPKEESRLVGQAEITVSGAGKVVVGQNVNIKFDDFPETEYGMVKGKVESVSLVRSKEFYSVRVIFPDSLHTSYKKTLPFIRNMQGNADIITEDLPFIVRIINPLKTIFYNNF